MAIEAEEGQRFFQYTSGTVDLNPGTHYTLTLTVGHNKLTVGGVSLTDWQEGSWGSEQNPETGTAEEIIPGVQPGTHTIVTLEPGQIAANKSWITEAMGTEGILKVSGPMNQADMDAISANKKTIKELDLSEATGEIVITNLACTSYQTHWRS